MLSIKFRTKRSADVRLSSPGVEVRGSKYWCVSNIILYWNGKVDTPYGSTLPKLQIISENASNKSCWALNFVQKSHWVHMCISPRSGARGSKDWYVSNIILYWYALSHYPLLWTWKKLYCFHTIMLWIRD